MIWDPLPRGMSGPHSIMIEDFPNELESKYTADWLSKL
jgi:hypothetical protein